MNPKAVLVGTLLSAGGCCAAVAQSQVVDGASAEALPLEETVVRGEYLHSSRVNALRSQVRSPLFLAHDVGLGHGSLLVRGASLRLRLVVFGRSCLGARPVDFPLVTTRHIGYN